MMDFNHQTSFYIEQKRRRREQESGETEKERVCERQRVVEERGSVSCKMGHRGNIMGEIKVGLKG
jgi:hypothetical protein